MKAGASEEEINEVVRAIEGFEYQPHVIKGVERTVIGAVGDEREKGKLQVLETWPGVENVVPILKPYKLASSEIKKEKSQIPIGEGVVVGGSEIIVMAGPCSVESEAQIIEVAKKVKQAGAQVLRGGAFKPRTSPYSFQGMEEEGLKLLDKARKATGLPIVTEVMESAQVDMVADYADMLQVGARNVQNFSLLKRLGKAKRPILLKRGLSTTIQEFLMSAEYILSHGNQQVVLCERGIRTFETATRNTLDISAIPVLAELTHLPVIVDPSHGTGVWHYVAPMALAAIAAGADGLMIEVHNCPEKALSDGPQALKPTKFSQLMEKARPLAELMGRGL